MKKLWQEDPVKYNEWKEYKPVRGIIEDFFKAAKEAFGLGKFHSFTGYVKNYVGCNIFFTHYS